MTGLTGPERFAVFSQGLWAFTGSSKTGISLNKPLGCENSIPRVSQVVSSEKEAASCLISGRGGGRANKSPPGHVISDSAETTRTQGQRRTLTLLEGERGHLPGLLYSLPRWGPPCGPRGLCHLRRPPFGPRDGHVCGVCSPRAARLTRSRCSTEVWRDNELSTRSRGPRGKLSPSRTAPTFGNQTNAVWSVLSKMVATSHL